MSFSALLQGIASRLLRGRRRAESMLGHIRRFPWRNTALTLRERFREDRLGSTAGSLTFTTTISLVPLLTVVLAVFSAFPMFARMESTVQKWLIQGLVPEHIARQVSNYVFQFASKATQIGWAGAVVFMISALAVVLTIDRKLNDIWRVRDLRPLTQRVLVYWGVLTLGPLMVGLSLSLSADALSTSRGWMGLAPGAWRNVLDGVEFLGVIVAMAALYRYVPNTWVRWSHALLGGLFAATAMELAKRLLSWYLAEVPAYSVVYGTFATVPILLIWVYLLWVIVLLGAVMVAYLPSLLAGVARRGDTPGWSYQLAIEALQALHTPKRSVGHGLSLEALAQQLKVDPLQLETPLATLVSLDWVGKLADQEERFVLLIDPGVTLAQPLLKQLLLVDQPSTEATWLRSGWLDLKVADLLNPAITKGLS
jgi:membrane protein